MASPCSSDRTPVSDGAERTACWSAERGGDASALASACPSFSQSSTSPGATAAGSFCDWVRHRFGASVLKEIYRTGGFENATKQALDTLEKDWHDFLATIRLEEEDLAIARHRFDRPATFEKICVHEVARLNRQAAQYAQMKRWDDALRLYDEAYRKSGGSPRARLRLFFALVDSGRTAAMQRESVGLLDSTTLTRVQKDAVYEVDVVRFRVRRVPTARGEFSVEFDVSITS